LGENVREVMAPMWPVSGSIGVPSSVREEFEGIVVGREIGDSTGPIIWVNSKPTASLVLQTSHLTRKP